MICEPLRAGWLVAIAFTLVATPAPGAEGAAAPEDRPSPQRLLADAEAAFRAGRFEEALEGFEEVGRLTGEVGLRYLVARCYEELGRLEDALATYEPLAREPRIPAEARGRADAAARVLRARLATGRLVLHVTPFGATVFVDGEEVGVAPLAPLELAPGARRITVRSPEGGTAVEEVEIRGGRTATVMVEVAAALGPGWLRLAVRPAGAAVAVGGRRVGLAPGEPLELAPGSHRVSVTHPGFETMDVGVEVRSGQTAVRSVALRPIGEVAHGGEPALPWVIVGVGAALVVGGGVAVWLGEEDHQEITSASGYDQGLVTGLSRDRAEALHGRGDTRKVVGWSLVGAGAAALVTSALVLALGEDPEGAEGTTIVPAASVDGDGAALGITGRF